MTSVEQVSGGMEGELCLEETSEGPLVLFPEELGEAPKYPLAPFYLRFASEVLRPKVAQVRVEVGGSLIATGTLADGGISFDLCWHRIMPRVWAMDLTLRVQKPKWEAASPVVVLGEYLLGDEITLEDVGWREADSPTAIRALADRPSEEGGGILPPYGYPVFTDRAFYAVAHPVGCVEREGALLRFKHHPQWENGEIRSPSLVMGRAASGSEPGELFARYFQTLRRPRPARAIVEINTFWTDQFDSTHGYTTDIPSYRRMAREWSRRVLKGERGLVSHFLLDAGWQNTASLYRPQNSLGGPGDEGLTALAEEIRAEGFQFGLWYTLNGPIGIDMNWARSAGFRVSHRGVGAGYSAGSGRLSYICLTDRNWEEQLSRRLAKVIASVGVDFMKGDWDNDAIEDATLDAAKFPTPEHLREAIADMMIRTYGRMHAARPGYSLRGAWWPSPWWFSHVDNTHLPNSGDMESTDLPSLTQRDAGLTSRDAVFYHVMRRCRTPVDFDVLVPHEFAHSRRNPVQDSETSWVNSLIMWLGRGNHYLQIYAAPYDIHGDRAWALREALRWFRAHEDLLWKTPTRMVGGDPGQGEVYGYLHQDGSRQLLIVRNPLAHPQTTDALWAEGLEPADWSFLYPLACSPGKATRSLASHEVRVLAQGFALQVPEGYVNRAGTPGLAFSLASGEIRHGTSEAIPDLHRLPAPSATMEVLNERALAIHASLPDGLRDVEIVLRAHSRAPGDTDLRASLGRYHDPVSTFPVGVTSLRTGARQGYAQRRLQQPPGDPTLVILRIPVGSGGEAHAYLDGATSLPSFEAGWIEAREEILPVEIRPTSSSLPPAPSSPPVVVCPLILP